MTFHNVNNNAQTVLWAAITSTSATSIQVVADVFPLAPFYLSVGDIPANGEIVEVTSKSGLTFTVVRAKDSTTAKTFPTGAKVQLLMTAGLINEIHKGIDNSAMFPQNNSILLDGLTIGNFTLSQTPVVLGNVTLA